jgi:lipoate---protein ligase
VTAARAWARPGLHTGDPAALLARSAELFEEMAQRRTPTLWWYRPHGAAIVLGRGQRGLNVETPLPVLERSSGGGAVLLDASLLSLDVLLPSDHPLLDGDVGAVFGHVGRVWAAALGALGVPALSVHTEPSSARRQAEGRERLLASVCYATAGRGEVLAGGRKLVGLSQRRRRWGALVQCGMLRRWEPDPLLEALGAPRDPGILAAAVGLDDLLADPPDDQTVIDAVERQMVGYTGRLADATRE